MSTSIHKTTIPKNPFRFMLLASKPFWIFAVFAILATIGSNAVGASVPYVFKRLIDLLANPAAVALQDVWFWAFVYVGISMVAPLLGRASGLIGLNWAAGVRAQGSKILTEYVTQHSHSFFANNFAGSIGAKIRHASNGARSMVGELMWGWLAFLTTLVISITLAFTANTAIGLIFVTWIIAIVPVNLFLLKKRLPLSVEVQKQESKLSGHITDVLNNTSAMRDYARRDFELKNMHALIDTRYEVGKRNWRFSEYIVLVNNIFEMIFVGGMILSTIYFWTQGLLTAGDVVLVATLIASVRRMISQLGQRFNDILETISEIREGLEVILHDHEVQDVENAKRLKVTEGAIEFKNVSFKYEGGSVFHKLNLRIKPGEKVGLVGHSGAGKSTLLKLLTRTFDLEKGAVLIDGQDIAQVTQDSLRGSVALVPQEPLLFHRSLEDNIRYGKLLANKKEVIEASKKAQAFRFIDALPDKFKTLVGERGVKLSGGERQRVAIARAFLKESKILLLDEATSSLDSESEMHIQAALEKLIEGKTVVAIAHRLSTLRSMDRIVVMDKGKIVQDGSHDELLKEEGVYADLWKHQAGGFVKG